MKQTFLGLLLVLFSLTSCKDDDKPSTIDDTNQLVAGTASATINGNDFSTNDNVSRYLSYGDFIIKSKDDGNFLNFQLNEFLGNAEYALVVGSGNSANYYTTVNNEFIGFESLTGQLTISDYNQSTKTFNAAFNITFGRIGNNSITIVGEGTYNQLEIIEISEPESGEMTAFHANNEYLNFQDSAVVFSNDLMVLEFQSLDNDQLTFKLSTISSNTEEVTATVNGIAITFTGSEILSFNYNAESLVVSGHFKNTNSETDLEVWFENIAVDTLSISSTSITLISNGEVISLVNGFVFENAGSGSMSEYTFNASNNESNLDGFVFLSNSPVPTGLNQTMQGFAFYSNIDTGTEFAAVSSIMTLTPGFFTGTVNVQIEIQGIGSLVGTDVTFIQ